MNLSTLMHLSPLDGRYEDQLADLRKIMSEYGLIYHRIIVEIAWLKHLAQTDALSEIPKLNQKSQDKLKRIINDFDLKEAGKVKEIESTTRHDVKAVEYYLQQAFKTDGLLTPWVPFIHFGCTSEDINNLAYALMLTNSTHQLLNPSIRAVGQQLQKMAIDYADISMLAHTHGQPATPTTLGKEFANIVMRIHPEYKRLSTLSLLGKMNGATGNLNAHLTTYPSFDWLTFTHDFIHSLNLTPNAYTTQIEPHDQLAYFLQTLTRLNTILIDLCRDIWTYISMGYLKQKSVATEVGSSTMPHKINPIDFENAEGNLGLANALATHLAHKLPVSRLQRDLSDSTVMRNLGIILGYTLLAYDNLKQGLDKINPNTTKIKQDLSQHWEVLAEAVQTMMRRYTIPSPYEKLKVFSRGKTLTQAALMDFIKQSELPTEAKKALYALTPTHYVGYAPQLAQGMRTLQWDD